MLRLTVPETCTRQLERLQRGTWIIEKERGDKETESDKVMPLWRAYSEELFSGISKQEKVTTESQKPSILEAEIENAIRRMIDINGNTPTLDMIQTELGKLQTSSVSVTCQQNLTHEYL